MVTRNFFWYIKSFLIEVHKKYGFTKLVPHICEFFLKFIKDFLNQKVFKKNYRIYKSLKLSYESATSLIICFNILMVEDILNKQKDSSKWRKRNFVLDKLHHYLSHTSSYRFMAGEQSCNGFLYVPPSTCFYGTVTLKNISKIY